VRASEIEILVSDAPDVDPKHLGVILGREDEKRMDSEGDESRHGDGQDVKADAKEEGADEGAFEDGELALGATEKDGPREGGIDPVTHQRIAPPRFKAERTATPSAASAPPKMSWERRRIPWEWSLAAQMIPAMAMRPRRTRWTTVPLRLSTSAVSALSQGMAGPAPEAMAGVAEKRSSRRNGTDLFMSHSLRNGF
jgi:hypothetical protein